MNNLEKEICRSIISEISSKYGLNTVQTSHGPVIEHENSDGSWVVISCIDDFELDVYSNYKNMIDGEPDSDTYFDVFDEEKIIQYCEWFVIKFTY